MYDCVTLESVGRGRNMTVMLDAVVDVSDRGESGSCGIIVLI